MNFRLIHLEEWERKPYFEHYLNELRCTFSITANIDISQLRAKLKSEGIKLYPALMFMLARIVNRHEEFRTCFNSEEELGIWESVSPSFTIFNEQSKTFSGIWAPYDERFEVFNEGYLSQVYKYKDAKTLLPDPSEPPNVFSVSSIPWVSFTGFNLNVYTDGKHLLPIFTFGKFVEENGKVLLPLSAQLHHAVCDGYHAGVLFQEMQLLADSPEQWINVL